MFAKLFQDDSEKAQKERAKLAFEKIASLKKEGGRDSRSARIRMVLLCRAHLDKTFIEGAEKTAAFEEETMKAIVAGSEKPPEPVAAEYQQVASVSGDKVWVYLPNEYAEIAFALGGSYQRTDLSAEQAIDAMQGLADQIFSSELGVDDPFLVLQFLRDEIGAPAGSTEAPSSDAPNE
ncbi:MAG: hypothetical protein RL357_977 [Pseudomonadota bacterium]|jgi:hypothetical protein